MFTDENDNVYVVGRLGASVDYDSGKASDAPADPNLPGIFIVKFDAAGAFRWDLVLDATQGFADTGLDLYVTPDGSAYITGGFRGEVSGLGSSCSLSAEDNSGKIPFLVKLDPNGACAWAEEYSGGATNSYGTGVRVNREGKILLVGQFQGSMTLGTTISSEGGEEREDGFVARLDAAGKPLWAKRYGGPENDSVDATIDAQGGMVVYGHFKGEASLDGKIATSEGDYDLFFMKYDPDGNQLWDEHKQAGGSWDEYPSRVLLDPASGDIFLTGHSTGAFDYMGHVFEGATGYDVMFAMKISQADGKLLWGSHFPQELGQTLDAKLDPLGNLVFGGVSTGNRDFGGGPLDNLGTEDAVLVKLNGQDGKHIFSEPYRGGGKSSIFGLAVDTHGYTIVTGRFEQQITFGDKTHTATPGADPYDTFVAKLPPR
ncbi:hypothetical protein WME94_30275 [Sorangium sp. So ce429]